MKQIYNINDIQPFIDVSDTDNILLGRNGELTAGFRIKLPPIFTKDINYFNELHSSLTSCISFLPDYIRLHKQDFFTLAPVETNSSDYLSEQRALMFSGQEVIKQTSFLYLTLLPAQIHDASLITSSLLRPIRKNKAGMETISLFRDTIHSFQAQIENLFKKEKDENNFFLKPLTKKDFLEVGKDSAGVLAKYFYLAQDYYSDIIFNRQTGDLMIGENFVDIISISSLNNLPLTIGPIKYYKPLSTEDTRLHLSMTGRIGAFMKFPHILNTIICKGNTEKEKKRLETKGTILSNFAATSRENRLASEEIDTFLESVATNGSEIVDCHFNVITWANTREVLFNQRVEIINTLKNLNLIPKYENTNKANLFFACTPGNSANIFKEYRFKTIAPVAVSFLNLDDLQENTTPTASFDVVDRFTGAPLNLDITDYAMNQGFIENLNKFVLGSSGSGKSVTMNYYTLCNLRNGVHTVIIDKGKSYEGICSAFSGMWFEFSNEASHSFNPFALHPFDYSDGKLSPMKNTTLLTIVKLLWRGPLGQFTESEITTLEKMFDAYYNSPCPRHCFNTFYEFVTNPETFSINPSINFPAEDFKYVLEQYYGDNKYGKLLNAEDSLNILENKLVVFELKGIENSKLFPLFACMIMDTILTKLNNLPQARKEILQDEAWKALANPILAIFFQELTKTIRKLNGELIFVTQEVEDLFDNPIIKNAILNNCATKILLSQNQFQKRFEQIQSLLGLSQHEKNLVFSLNKNKKDNSRDILLLYSNGPAAVYSIKLCLAEYLVCTSKLEEKEGIRTVARYLNCSYFEAIKYIVAHLADKIADIQNKASAQGKKIPYNVAVEKVLENLQSI